ncbi:V-type ATP synthase subunit E [Youxingia wuxianensis]|uniref:V-type proton ATPase subunit E n=1 Tax=Youxingia wuxianensis TaxID=2763678 RepID=A0A926IGW3_9FIRM|nr:V-type ATP synthase subunit E [Youxingia wuxianensis]MBC8584098.1 hypothetical protein [Youxingia wuxianensis]
MDTLENNINLILDEISSLAQEERLAISKQAEDFQEKELSRVKESIEQGAERKIQDDMDEIIESAKKQIAQFDNDQKQKLLNHREELIQRVFATVGKKLSEYTYTDKYEQEILAKVTEAGANHSLENSIFQMTKRDSALYEKIKEAFGMPCEVKSDVTVEIGGFKLVNLQQGILIDETLDNRLQEQKRWFYQNCDLGVTEGVK